MNILSKEDWLNHIGSIPEGFFIRIKRELVCLYYNGKYFETFVQPSEAGRLLERNACLISFSSVTDAPEKIAQRIKKSIGLIISEIKKKTQKPN